jgi:hypothetical protein
MRQLYIIVCVATAMSVCVATASAESSAKPTWTESKAERLVLSGATVPLPVKDRVALEEELARAAALYQGFALDTSLNGDAAGAFTVNPYYELWSTYVRALNKVQRGLAIDVVDCRGSGAVGAGRRFGTFRCSVISESLQIPWPTLADDGTIAAEGQPRTIGPTVAELEVRVTGTSRFAYRAR